MAENGGSMAPARVTTTDWALFFVCVATWGSAYAAVHVALQGGASPWTITAARMWMGTLLLHGFLWAQRARNGEPLHALKITPRLVLLGIAGGTAPFALLSFAQLHISSGLTGILAALTPLMVGATAPLVAPEEKLTVTRLIGLLLGFAGVVVLTGPAAFSTAGASMLPGVLAATGAAASYALNALIARHGEPIPPLEASAGWTFWGALLATPFMLLMPSASPPMPVAWLMIALLALGPTALASLAYFRLVRTAGPGFLTQANYVLPLWAVTLGVIAFGEKLEPNMLAALLLIGLGLVTTQGGWRALALIWRRPSPP
jgi:drug/metabolite transporter (DMT)-like permease